MLGQRVFTYEKDNFRDINNFNLLPRSAGQGCGSGLLWAGMDSSLILSQMYPHSFFLIRIVQFILELVRFRGPERCIPAEIIWNFFIVVIFLQLLTVKNLFLFPTKKSRNNERPYILEDFNIGAVSASRSTFPFRIQIQQPKWLQISELCIRIQEGIMTHKHR